MNSICVRSPGRINFIGEHVDYIYTFSCPATIDLYNDITILRNCSKSVSIYSDRFGKASDITYDMIYNVKEYDFSKSWYGYFIGIIRSLADKGIKINEGIEVKIISKLMDGAGLSSSASIEVGFLYGLNSLFSLGLSDIDIVKIAKYSENNYMNSPCGIMDQYTVMFGKENSFLFLNYHDLSHKYCALPDNLRYFIFDTKIKHSIAAEGYKSRIKEKDQITNILKENFNISLRDAVLRSIDDYQFYTDVILKIDDSTLNKRFNHFVSETNRVNNFYSKIKDGEINLAFSYLNQSHISLSNLYEVSIPVIDELVFEIQKIKDVIGCRMIGGGFGGSCLAVSKDNIDPDMLKNIVKKINEKYSSEIAFFEIKISDAVHLL